MTRDSAQRYDTQVEVVLNGSANATRRQALPPFMRFSPGETTVGSEFLMSAVAPDAFSIC
jgi:hypothetical protein